MSGNPFRPAEQVAPKVKCLIYGPSGAGKTYFALTAPGPIAVIDTEGGTAFYANRVGPKGLSPFDVLPTKTFAQVEQAIAYLRANPNDYATLVVDPVTVLWETLQDAAQHRRAEVRRDAEADLEMLDWQRIKRAYKRLMTDLVNLPLHVVVVAREQDLTEDYVTPSGRKERRKIGVKPDTEKSTPYYFDTVLRIVPASRGGREVIVEKDRTGTHALNAKLVSPAFGAVFDKAIAAEGTGVRELQSDEQAARIDAATTMSTEELRDRDETVTPIAHITRTGAIARGDGIRSDLMARLQPDGYLIGFRLEVGDGKAIPQVVVNGALGTALYLACDRDPATLLGQMVTVEGELFEVHPAGRRKYHRLEVTRIAHAEWTIPAEDEPADPPTEAESVPMFSPDEQAAIDAALDELERVGA